MDTCTEQKNSGERTKISTRDYKCFSFSFYLKIIFNFVRDFNVKHRCKRAMSLKVFRGETFQ